MFQAIDFSLSESEEQQLSSSLENLIGRMTGNDITEDTADDDGDEGIERDSGDLTCHKCGLSDVIQVSIRYY